MTRRATEQSWITDTLLAGNGYEVLHPESRHFLGVIGYDPVDFNRILSRVKAASMFPKAYGEVALELEQKALYYERSGLSSTANNLFNRANMLYARARHAFAPSDVRHPGFNEAVARCTAGLIRNSDVRIEEVVVEFEKFGVHAIAHFPTGAGPWPVVVLLPGMDMRKEDWTKVAREHYVARGYCALAVDGPGQGATAIGGLRATTDNYERAISAVLDSFLARSDVDGSRVGMWGVSMGSYWGLRTAALDSRIGALSTAMGCYGSMDIIFGRAQPAFKANFMRMTGYKDEDNFATEIASKMEVLSLAPKVECPVMMAYGEFDELSTLDETIALYEALGGEKLLMVFEQEFHALGGVGAEMVCASADWLDRALSASRPLSGEAYLMRSGEVLPSARPKWWSLGAPSGRDNAAV